MRALGDKIMIVGVSGSGKSTFARKLSVKNDIPVYHTDSIMWKPGWNYVGEEETANQLSSVLNNSKWIIEGYVVKTIRARVFDEADTILYLDYSRLVSVYRYLGRCWKNRVIPRPELEGSPEKFSFKFLKLIWTKGETISLNKFLKAINQEKIIRLKSPKETKRLLDSI